MYLKYARKIKLLRGTMEHELREFQRKNTNGISRCNDTAIHSLSAYNVAEKVKKRYPGCDVEMYNIMSKDIEVALREGKYNFVIGPALELNSDFGIDMLVREPYILIVPDRYDMQRLLRRREERRRYPKINLGKLAENGFYPSRRNHFCQKGNLTDWLIR